MEILRNTIVTIRNVRCDSLKWFLNSESLESDCLRGESLILIITV